MKILLVDDDAALLEALPPAIRHRLPDAFVYAVSSPSDALAQAAATHWDLVITDLLMPGMTADQLIPALREIAPEVPIILITGVPEVAGKRNDQDASIIIRKPFKVQDLVDHIIGVLERRRTRSHGHDERTQTDVGPGGDVPA
ncbi:response regulator [Candidatus Nitrospira bockiana]